MKSLELFTTLPRNLKKAKQNRIGERSQQPDAITLPGNLKTVIVGTCHVFSFAKYAYCYLAESQYHFNRHSDLRTRLHRLPGALVSVPPCSTHSLRLAKIGR